MRIQRVQLVCCTANVGHGANDGAYYPVGLLTVASLMQKEMPEVRVVVDDQHHRDVFIRLAIDVVGIQVASTLCYKNALEIAEAAKRAGKTVVLGGPHTSVLYDQIMKNRHVVDYVIRGHGERPFVELIRALNNGADMTTVPSLSWRRGDEVVHNPMDMKPWDYESYLPLPFDVLSDGIETYWKRYREAIDGRADAAFLVFTHFGCGYREAKLASVKSGESPLFTVTGRPRFCSFCALQDPAGARRPERILAEIRSYLDQGEIARGSRIALKCYGDSIGSQGALVKGLAEAVEHCPWWKDYEFYWVFYCQSSRVTEELAVNLKRIGTMCLFIGFDSICDRVQKLNGLGTNRRSHERAVEICARHGTLIQAASVIGQIGETPQSLEEDLRFYESLAARGVLERINSAIMFIIPGSAVYELLCQHEPWMREQDLLPTDETRELWVRHFCPEVSTEMLREYVQKIDALSPGPHSKMGYDK